MFVGFAGAAWHAADDFFLEQFLWQGNHGAVIKGGTASTVWWSENDWDVRISTENNSISYPNGSAGHHVDIHRSVPGVLDGTQANQLVIGGNGDQGVGIMHIDFEAITSARLRNPMLISAANPGVVEFYAPIFSTTGHWWEVAIAPTGTVIGGEVTAVPNAGSNPIGKFNGNAGSGPPIPEESLNFIVMGRNDVPCKTGWEQAYGFSRYVGGVRSEHLGSSFLSAGPAERDKLYGWRLEYYPSEVRVYADIDRNGAKELLDTFPLSIPWSEVYVYLLGVGYQSAPNKHPQECDAGDTFFSTLFPVSQPQVRELPWKQVKVSPVKYQATRAYPKNKGTEQVPKDSGWTGYDIRDTQRFGLPVVGPLLGALGIPQANETAYSKHASMAFCHETGAGWFDCKGGPATKTLTFELPTGAVQSIDSVKFVYDVKKDGAATLKVNGVSVGSLPKAGTVASYASDPAQWIQRSVDVPAALLQAGTNTIDITMSGNIGFDRLHFEFGYGGSSPAPPPPPPPPPVPIPPPPAIGALPWLHTEGSAIKNEAGEIVVLRGVNIERREYLWASGPSIAYEKLAIPVATGPPAGGGWGANVILIAFASGPVNRNDAVYLGFLDEIVALAKANNAYTLLVWRYGEPNSSQPSMPDQAAEDALAKLALRYSNEPAVLYGLQVEPHDVSWSRLKPRLVSMVDAIRTNNPKALIAVPGTQWGRYVYHQLADPINRPNLIFKSHAYDTWPTIQGIYRFSDMLAAGYPIILGEFGPGSQMTLGDVKSLLDDAESRGISWIGWLFSDEACPCMLANRTTFAPTSYGAEIRARLRKGIGLIPVPPGLLGDIWGPAAKLADPIGKRGDGKVNIHDVSRLLTLWGRSDASSLAEGDINAGPSNVSKGRIDLFDANLMMRNWSP